MLVVLCLWVHDGAVCLAVRGLIHMCIGSHRSCSLSVAAIWNHVGKSVVGPLFFFFKQLFQRQVLFLFFCFLTTTPLCFLVFRFPLWSQCNGHPGVLLWRLMAGLRGLLAMGTFYCLRGWFITVEALRHPRHAPSTQLDAVVNFETTLIFSRS